MTAMCDVSFLLLTFFMLTSKFRPPEAVPVDLPNSQSQVKLENIMTITVSQAGAAYFSLSEAPARAQMLENMLSKRHPEIKLSNDQKNAFKGMDQFGFSFAEMPAVLNLNPQEFKNYKQRGIPMDSMKNELYEWIQMARYVDPTTKIAVKGDKDADIKAIKKVMSTLTERSGIHKFNLITTLAGNAQKGVRKEGVEEENK